MHWPRLLLAAAFLALLAAPHGSAQPSFTEPYQVRAAMGDIPTTEVREGAGTLNIEQRLVVQFDNQSSEEERTYRFNIPPGATFANATCDCPRSTRAPPTPTSFVDFTIDPSTPSGQRTIRVLSTQPAGAIFGGRIVPTIDAPAERIAIVYVPADSQVTSEASFDTLPGVADPRSIAYARFTAADPMPNDFWFAVHPATTADAPVAVDRFDDGMVWVFLVLGIVVGAILWAILVKRGVVQKRSRRQTVATAAHVEAATTEPPAVLEGKKRALLAALKEVELAKQANEMPPEVYDAVKADLKKQAVTVMRALESKPEQA